MDYICKGKRLGLKRLLVFKDLQEAQDMGLMPWSELSEILLKTCGDPQGTHTPCRNSKECSFCKTREDDRSYNPLVMETLGWRTIPQGINGLIKLQEEHNWLVENPIQSMQNLFNHCAEGNYSKSDKSCLQNWGFILCKPEQATHIRSKPSDYSFVEHEVMVQGQKTHMFSIQHDPGNNRYAYMADDIWNISHVGFTKPNPNSIGNVIETLLSLWLSLIHI